MSGPTNVPAKDAFLSHHTPDKPAVAELAERLENAGIDCWLDTWNLIPGDPIQTAMAEALRDCRCCVVFCGPSGGGPWQNEEVQWAMAQCVEQPETYRVLPVLLPDGRKPERSSLPEFLMSRLWVEFRDTLDDADAFHRLVCGIRGVQPGIGPVTAPPSNEEPYRGLEPFLEQHARFFFGREAQVEVLLDKLRDGLQKPDAMRFLAIVGASGSGKSSLAQAGLIPALRRGGQPGDSSQWPVLVLRPGPRPLESLAVALAGDPTLGVAARDPLTLCDQLAQDQRRLHMTVLQALRGTADSHRAVLVVDQFEETFTLCPDEDAVGRAMFIDNLLHAATVYGGRTLVVLTMRADFYEHCSAHTRLAAAVSDHQDLVTCLDEAQLREAIERPAALCGAEFEPGLVELLVRDMRGQTGALPLLQHVLHELWERGSRRRLTHAAYRELGGLDGALERRAEDVYGSFASADQDLCRRIFLRLTQLGRGTEDTKRRVAVDELSSATAGRAEIDQVLDRLAAERLVTMSGTSDGGQRTVEVAHEALIRTWGRLRQWIDSRRQQLLCRDRLSEAARAWKENPGDASFLYHGTPLEQADKLAAGPPAARRVAGWPSACRSLDRPPRALDRPAVEQTGRARCPRGSRCSVPGCAGLGRLRPAHAYGGHHNRTLAALRAAGGPPVGRSGRRQSQPLRATAAGRAPVGCAAAPATGRTVPPRGRPHAALLGHQPGRGLGRRTARRTCQPYPGR